MHTLANSKDRNEMPYNVVFHQWVCFDKNNIQRKFICLQIVVTLQEEDQHSLVQREVMRLHRAEQLTVCSMKVVMLMRIALRLSMRNLHGGCYSWTVLTSLHLFTSRPVVSVSNTVVPTKSDSDVIFCLQLLSKTLTCTIRLS